MAADCPAAMSPGGASTRMASSGSQVSRARGVPSSPAATSAAGTVRRSPSPAIGAHKAAPSSAPALTPTMAGSASASSPVPRRAVPLLGGGGVSGLLGSGLAGRTSTTSASATPQRRAHRDLTQKLRAMDLALERIETSGASGAAANSMPSSTLDGAVSCCGQTESSFEHQHQLCACTRPSVESDDEASCLPVSADVATADSAPPADAGGNVAAFSQSLRVALGRLDQLEASWRDSHASLRNELTRELSAFKEGQEIQMRNGESRLSDFEVQITEALEVRAREADGLLEKKLVEAGAALQRKVSELCDFEAAARSDRERLAGLSGDAHRRLSELEASARADRQKVAETSQSCSEALQVAKEQMSAFRERVQQLQESGDSARSQLHNLEDALGVRLRETESRLVTQHRDTEGQVRELQKQVGEVERRLLGEVHRAREGLSAAAATARPSDAATAQVVDELRRSCDIEFSAVQSRLEVIQLRCAEDAREAFQAQQAETEARITGLVEERMEQISLLRADVEEHREQDRITFSQQLDELRAACTEEAKEAAITEVEHQLHLLRIDDEERCLLSRQLEALGERQQRQQGLLEELLAAAARRPVGDSAAGGLPPPEALAIRVEALAGRVAVAEERSAAAAAAAASASAASTAAVAPATEVQEMLRVWPPRLDDLASRIDRGHAELRAELIAELRAGLRAAEETGCHFEQRLHALGTHAASCDAERQELAERLAGQAARAEGAEAAATSSVNEVRQLKEMIEAAFAKATPAALEVAANATTEKEGGMTSIAARLEARLEVAESRQRVATQELRSRLEDVERQASRLDTSGTVGETPWAVPLRALELEVKSLLSSQVEDSTSAFRSIIQMVEELQLQCRNRPAEPVSEKAGVDVSSQ
eukprot:gnl/TRDRNA2_/TRDRNA2_83805_c0_seq1.p1 gnl/TRDRNA2_/TRDRNA2_83805_c0~~gnl/TRDRNA2_/TRDRNA2_83805_c0_seq1.p1  ORF type:complete len:897 (-),score=208.48 gnl/TRDRNA2_/TRDRNA2_83805_c0_seq1:155-2824(-)